MGRHHLREQEQGLWRDTKKGDWIVNAAGPDPTRKGQLVYSQCYGRAVGILDRDGDLWVDSPALNSCCWPAEDCIPLREYEQIRDEFPLLLWLIRKGIDNDT